MNDVLADLRTIVSAALPSSSPDELDRALLPALKQYHAEQFTVVDLPALEGAGGKTLVTPVSRLGAGEEGTEERHVNPKGATSFVFDAATAVSHPVPRSARIQRSLSTPCSHAYARRIRADGGGLAVPAGCQH